VVTGVQLRADEFAAVPDIENRKESVSIGAQYNSKVRHGIISCVWSFIGGYGML
jgi:hypothetical protein